MYYALAIFSVFISVISQVLLKKSADTEHKNIISEYLNPYVVIAYVIFAIATLSSVITYKGLPLSVCVALESTSYIFIVIFDKTIFHVNIGAKKVAALALIIAGVIMTTGLYKIV